MQKCIDEYETRQSEKRLDEVKWRVGVVSVTV